MPPPEDGAAASPNERRTGGEQLGLQAGPAGAWDLGGRRRARQGARRPAGEKGAGWHGQDQQAR